MKLKKVIATALTVITLISCTAIPAVFAGAPVFTEKSKGFQQRYQGSFMCVRGYYELNISNIQNCKTIIVFVPTNGGVGAGRKSTAPKLNTNKYYSYYVDKGSYLNLSGNPGLSFQ